MKEYLDNLDIQVKFDGNKIIDVRYDGEACAICTSSTSIMSELVIGKTLDEAKEQWELLQEQADKYYDDVERIYERRCTTNL